MRTLVGERAAGRASRGARAPFCKCSSAMCMLMNSAGSSALLAAAGSTKREMHKPKRGAEAALELPESLRRGLGGRQVPPSRDGRTAVSHLL